MELTRKQEEGLRIALYRYENNEKYTVIGGYAGAGKSTLVRFIVEALCNDGLTEDDICYATFTGKAAQVLLKKGNRNVSTLHKLLFKSIPTPNGKFIRTPVPEIPYNVVIVDEVSMAPKELMDRLASYPVHIICLGDPGQLPPVDKDQDNGLLHNPHIFLDEVMRQAQESEIIRLSMDIREGKEITYSKGKEVVVLPQAELNTGMLKWADQILCGTNNTRVNLNNNMRRLLGREGAPQDGDKIICLRNYWDCFSDTEDPLVNGTIGFLKDPYESYFSLPRYIGPNRVDIINGTFVSDSNSIFNNLNMDKKLILEGEKSIDWRTSYKMNKNPKYAGLIPKEFTYGYAITTHKAQGSEWSNVLVVEEKFPFSKEEHQRWLYTSVTRASDKLLLVK